MYLNVLNKVVQIFNITLCVSYDAKSIYADLQPLYTSDSRIKAEQMFIHQSKHSIHTS